MELFQRILSCVSTDDERYDARDEHFACGQELGTNEWLSNASSAFFRYVPTIREYRECHTKLGLFELLSLCATSKTLRGKLYVDEVFKPFFERLTTCFEVRFGEVHR